MSENLANLPLNCVRCGRQPIANSPGRPGTELLIRELRQSWDEQDIQELRRLLSLLTPPFERVEDFQVRIDNDVDEVSNGVGLCVYDRVVLDIGQEIYESDSEHAGEIEIPADEVVAKASWRILDEFAIVFEWIRNSLRNVLLDIEKCVAQRNLMNSDAFWRRFILAAVQTKKQETQLWDFKETLTVWHAKGDAKNSAKVTFAEDVASFANAEGGVLIVGVNNNREIVGIGSGGELESKLKFARDILAERLDYPRAIVSFHQVMVPDTKGEKACLAVIIARAIEAVGVSDGDGQFTYPVRRETGISRESRRDIDGAKTHAESDDHDFMDKLEQFVRDNQG